MFFRRKKADLTFADYNAMEKSELLAKRNEAIQEWNEYNTKWQIKWHVIKMLFWKTGLEN